MSDREVVEKAIKTKKGDKFLKLYNGNPVLENKRKDEMSLMSRLAMFCNGDKEQLLRVFKSSGQHRTERENTYEKMVQESINFIANIKTANASKIAYVGEHKNIKAGENAKA